MGSMDRWIDRHRKRLQIGCFLQHFADFLSGFLLLFGSAVLIVKLLIPALWPHVLWLGLGGIPVTLAAWWLSRRNAYTRSDSIAMLDRKLEAGGLLMTLSETHDREWAGRLPQLQEMWKWSLPRYRPVRFARYTILPLVFALGTCAIPLREARTESLQHETVGRQAVEELEQMLESIDEAAILNEEKKEQLRQEIEQLAEDTERTPLSHEKWETVDALRERMQLELTSSTLSLSKAGQAASQLAQQAAGDAQDISLERTRQLEADVLQALQKMAGSGDFSSAPAGLRNRLRQMAQSGQLPRSQNAAARQQTLQDLKDFLDQESQKLSQLRSECGGKNCPHCGSPQQGGT